MGQRENKGKNLIEFPDKYVCIDIETTGLDFDIDEIIEISGVLVKEGIITNRFSSLVKTHWFLPDFITDLTGITNEMLENAPILQDVIPNFLNFIEDYILVGHNVHFDINFIYDAAERSGLVLKNDFIDTMRIARKLLPNLNHHRLKDLVEYYAIQQDTAHRAEADAIATIQCYEAMKQAIQNSLGFEAFKDSFAKHKSSDYYNRLRSVKATVEDCDETHPVYNKCIVFTGALSSMTRKEAYQLVVNLGAHPEDTITKNTNFLVIGNENYLKAKKEGKTRKMIKAENYKKKGQDIEILSEKAFLELIKI